jgi:hypothetical protein
LTIWLAKPSVQSVWGLGVLSVMIHSYVDYPLRDPVLGFFWFTLAGGLTGTRRPASANAELPTVKHTELNRTFSN